MPVAKLFQALGDTTRLEIVQRLSSGQKYTLSSVSNGLDISRQGARKHLQILADANIVILEQKGRDVQVRLDRKTLDTGKEYIAKLERQWDARLEALRQVLEKK